MSKLHFQTLQPDWDKLPENLEFEEDAVLQLLTDLVQAHACMKLPILLEDWIADAFHDAMCMGRFHLIIEVPASARLDSRPSVAYFINMTGVTA